MEYTDWVVRVSTENTTSQTNTSGSDNPAGGANNK